MCVKKYKWEHFPSSHLLPPVLPYSRIQKTTQCVWNNQPKYKWIDNAKMPANVKIENQKKKMYNKEKGENIIFKKEKKRENNYVY